MRDEVGFCQELDIMAAERIQLSEYWHIWFGLLLLAVTLWGQGGVIGLLTGRARPHD